MSRDTLDLLGVSPAAARIVRYYLVRPDARPHAREIQRALGLGGASLQRELQRMIDLGALSRQEEDGRTYYGVVADAPLWRAMRILESATPDPIPLLRDAVADVAGIHGAFLFGSAAAGEAREDSDLDIMVVEGPSVERRKLLEHLTEVGIILGREVNLVRYTPHSLAERLGDVMHPARAFVRGVLRRRKRWIAGDPKALESITAAAGIRAEELAGAA